MKEMNITRIAITPVKETPAQLRMNTYVLRRVVAGEFDKLDYTIFKNKLREGKTLVASTNWKTKRIAAAHQEISREVNRLETEIYLLAKQGSGKEFSEALHGIESQICGLKSADAREIALEMLNSAKSRAVSRMSGFRAVEIAEETVGGIMKGTEDKR